MAKARVKTTSPARAVALTISTSDAVIDELEVLVSTGLYGRSIEEAAERLLCVKLAEIFPPELLKIH